MSVINQILKELEERNDPQGNNPNVAYRKEGNFSKIQEQVVHQKQEDPQHLRFFRQQIFE